MNKLDYNALHMCVVMLVILFQCCRRRASLIMKPSFKLKAFGDGLVAQFFLTVSHLPRCDTLWLGICFDKILLETNRDRVVETFHEVGACGELRDVIK